MFRTKNFLNLNLRFGKFLIWIQVLRQNMNHVLIQKLNHVLAQKLNHVSAQNMNQVLAQNVNQVLHQNRITFLDDF